VNISSKRIHFDTHMLDLEDGLIKEDLFIFVRWID
jgi:hypothetical protein